MSLDGRIQTKHLKRTGLTKDQFSGWVARLVDERAKSIMTLRQQGMTLRDVGVYVNLSRPYTAQIESQVLTRIRFAAAGNPAALKYFIGAPVGLQQAASSPPRSTP